MRRTYQLLYRVGVVPWDGDEIPPPVRGLADQLPPGIAVDLGCGTGALACALAERGWTVIAVDFVAGAVATARRRPGAERVRWRVADVTDPAAVDPGGNLAGNVALLLDNGCAHGIPDTGRAGWASTVEVLAGPGATCSYGRHRAFGRPSVHKGWTGPSWAGCWAPAGVSSRRRLPAGTYTSGSRHHCKRAMNRWPGFPRPPGGVAPAVQLGH